MPNYFSEVELERLRALRTTFLFFEDRGTELGGLDYWDEPELLALYDSTFGQRIGWKWDAVLHELALRKRLPRGRTVLDWGCGTGIAARRYLAAAKGVERVVLWDHSAAARTFAKKCVRAEFPELEVVTELPQEEPDVLLVSHVLDELDADARAELEQRAARVQAVLWVEPGSRRVARALGEMRARLMETHDVLAPCTHQASCGALANERGWCHFFACPPQAVYTEGRWAELGRELGIDLRSLPYSFLVLARRGAFELTGAQAGPSARLLARPRLTRGRAELEVCDAAGVRALDYLQRLDKQVFKELDDVRGEPWLFDLEVAGRRILTLTRPPRAE